MLQRPQQQLLFQLRGRRRRELAGEDGQPLGEVRRSLAHETGLRRLEVEVALQRAGRLLLRREDRSLREDLSLLLEVAVCLFDFDGVFADGPC